MSSLADLTPSPSSNVEESDYRVCHVLVYILPCVSVYAPTGLPVRSGQHCQLRLSFFCPTNKSTVSVIQPHPYYPRSVH